MIYAGLRRYATALIIENKGDSGFIAQFLAAVLLLSATQLSDCGQFLYRTSSVLKTSGLSERFRHLQTPAFESVPDKLILSSHAYSDRIA